MRIIQKKGYIFRAPGQKLGKEVHVFLTEEAAEKAGGSGM